MKPVGIQQNIFFYGVVESREDPEKLGRVKVRVLGVHSDNTSEVPTEALPWAPVIMPSTEAAQSGIGWSPTGILPGSWVVVYFADGINCQSPVVIGTTNGINPSTKSTSETVVSTPTASSNTPTNTNTLGSISEKYESGGNGPASISTGKGDAGGKSYGTYQLASKNGMVQAFVKQSSYAKVLGPLTVTSAEFDAKWKSLASDPAFGEEQRQFIEKSNFVPCSNKLGYLDLSKRSQGVSEMVWSYSVQYGPSGGASKITRGLNGKNVPDLSDADIAELCYNDRIAMVATDFSKSPTLHASLVNRFKAEKKDVLKMIGSAPTANLKKGNDLPKDTYNQPIESAAKVEYTPAKDNANIKTGFVDPTGKYPKKSYLGKSNTNRLAKVEDIAKTIQNAKKSGLVKGNGFTEPYTFGAKYPYNRVLETESGHVFEFDDTEGAERVHIYHRSGSFIEFHPDGTIVKKSTKDDNEVVISNKSVYVFGNSNVFVEGEVKIQSLGNMTLESEANITIRAGGNLQLEAAGNVDIAGAGTMDLFSGSVMTQYATMITQNNGSGSKNITVDIGEKIQATKEAAVAEEPEVVDDWGVTEGPNAQIVPDKATLDKESGFVTDSGAPTTTAKEIVVPSATIVAPSTTVLEETDKFLGNFKLSDKYVLADLTTDCKAFKYSLKAQAGLSEKEIVSNMMNLAANVLEPIREHFGKSAFIITSAFRHVSGSNAKPSHHHKGGAVDLQFPGNADQIPHIAQEIRKLLPNWTQIIIEYHAKNPVIHISWMKGDMRKQTFSSYTTTFSGMPVGIRDSKQNLIYK